MGHDFAFMRRRNPLLTSLFTLVGGVVFAFFFVKGCAAYNELREGGNLAKQRRDAGRMERKSAAAQTVGMKILKDYGKAGRSAKDDLADMAHALQNFALLVKGDTPIPLGANEEIANALKGKNRARLRFLPDDAPCFNAQGQIIDRWGAALFFHAADQDRIDIRSAGPDQAMWSPDDLHRTFDGRFLAGDDLNAPSLLEATQGGRRR